MGIHSTNNEWFQYFPLKSYFTKTDSKNTFGCYCNIAKQYFNIKYFGTMVLFNGNCPSPFYCILGAEVIYI